MQTSDTITAIMPALLKAQAAFAPAVKAKVNPHFKSKYVPLDAVLDAIAEPLRTCGIAILQPTTIQDGRTVLVTRLVHESGEWIEGRYPVHPVKADPQGEGSALTYARRYALMAIVGIAPEDDDGNAAVKATQRETATVTRITPTDGVWDGISEERAAQIADIASVAQEYLDADDIAGARDYLARSGLEGANEQTAVMTFFQSYEKAAMKKHHNGDFDGATDHLIRNRKKRAA